jgi:NAD-dependent dihydropyrimidine dehydrogenase PreA subunit
VITHLCTTCGGPVGVARLDVTTTSSGPKFIYGRWETCAGCGSIAEPMQVVDANDQALGLGQWERP